VEAIYQDQKGFIWIGTRDGLNRFDGYQMVVYRYDANNPASLSDNFIRYIYEDKSHNLWIGTINGLNRFDRAKNSFTRYKHIPGNPQSISNNLVTCIYEDRKGNLWIALMEVALTCFYREKMVLPISSMIQQN
jgi:ligand-binding sensor domain-containing protein